MNRIWKTLRNNRIWCVLLCAGLLFAGLMVNGEPSLAYFTSQDEVVNQAHGAALAIKLFEPQWYATGMELAKTMEPGITIPKDPYVYNASEVPVYVRMQVKIYQQDENGQVLVKDGVEQEVTEKQREAILGIIYCRVKETSEDKEDSEETTAESTDEITTETTSDATAKTILVQLLQKTPDSEAQVSETQDSAENQEQTQTEQWTSDNPNFVYKDGWFYYGTEVDGTLSCKALAPGEATPTLFDQLEIPVLKTEYNELLDEPFVIRVVAEAVTEEQIETEWNGGT